MTAAVPSAIARKTSRRQKTRRVAGVTLTATGLGWRAQGWSFEHVEASPAYWVAASAVGQRFEGRSLRGLVVRMTNRGWLSKDGA